MACQVGRTSIFLRLRTSISAARELPAIVEPEEDCDSQAAMGMRVNPRTSGKAQRLIKSLEAGRAYAMPFTSSDERKRWLPDYLAIYNRRRFNMAISDRTPFQQLNMLRVTYCSGEYAHLSS
jgi:hypothetical protein